MKKTTLLTILSLTALVLSACSAAGTGSSSSSTAGGGFRASSAFRNRPLTPEARLALGIVKLEGTPQAVDATEAAKLLPLWQLLGQLLGTSSSAPQEVSAVLDQIQATMTPDQVKTIAGMQLTSADMFAAFQQQAQGGSASSTDPTGSSSSTNRTAGGGRGGGFFLGGGGIPGGGGFGANRTGTGTNGSASPTSPAQAAQQFSNQVSLILVNQVVQLLQSRVKS